MQCWSNCSFSVSYLLDVKLKDINSDHDSHTEGHTCCFYFSSQIAFGSYKRSAEDVSSWDLLEATNAAPRMCPAVTRVSKFCLHLTSCGPLLQCFLAWGQMSPGLRIILGWECGLLLLTSSLHSRSAFIQYLCHRWLYCTSCLSTLFSSSAVFSSPPHHSYSVLLLHLEGQRLCK